MRNWPPECRQINIIIGNNNKVASTYFRITHPSLVRHPVWNLWQNTREKYKNQTNIVDVFCCTPKHIIHVIIIIWLRWWWRRRWCIVYFVIEFVFLLNAMRWQRFKFIFKRESILYYYIILCHCQTLILSTTPDLDTWIYAFNTTFRFFSSRRHWLRHRVHFQDKYCRR